MKPKTNEIAKEDLVSLATEMGLMSPFDESDEEIRDPNGITFYPVPSKSSNPLT